MAQAKATPPRGDWELHWTITPTDDGCVLRLEHRGFDPDNPQHRFAFDAMGTGRRTLILPKLAEGLL